MSFWEVIFYPNREERNSPYEYLVTLKNTGNAADTAGILHRLETMQEIRLPNDWPYTIKKINAFHQLTVGRHRVYFCLDQMKIVVFYICPKKGRKAYPRDLKRARAQYEAYQLQQGEKAR